MSPRLSVADVQVLRAVLDAKQSELTARRRARQAWPPRARAVECARRSILARAAQSPATLGQLRVACPDYRYGGQVSARDVFTEVFDDVADRLAMTAPAEGQRAWRYSTLPATMTTTPREITR